MQYGIGAIDFQATLPAAIDEHDIKRLRIIEQVEISELDETECAYISTFDFVLRDKCTMGFFILVLLMFCVLLTLMLLVFCVLLTLMLLVFAFACGISSSNLAIGISFKTQQLHGVAELLYSPDYRCFFITGMSFVFESNNVRTGKFQRHEDAVTVDCDVDPTLAVYVSRLCQRC